METVAVKSVLMCCIFRFMCMKYYSGMINEIFIDASGMGSVVSAEYSVTKK